MTNSPKSLHAELLALAQALAEKRFSDIDWGLVTRLAVASGPALAALHDVLVYDTAGNDATISKVFLSHAAAYPVVALAAAYTAGVLCGHFFVPQHVAA